MTDEQRTALVQGQLEAYNRRDLNDFCRFFHQRVTAIRLANNIVLCENMKQFRSIYDKMFAESPRLHCELLTRIVLPETVIDHERVTGRGSSPDILLACAIYGFRDGLIDRVWFTR